MATDKNKTKTKGNTTKKSGTAARSKTSTKSNTKTNAKKKSTEENYEAKEKYIPTEKEVKLHKEIKLLIGLAITILLMCSNFGLLSPVGDYLAYFMFGICGFLAYIVPVFVFLGIAFLVSNEYNRKSVIKFSAASVLLVLLASIIQLVFMEYDASKSVWEYYSICGSRKIGGGLIGAIIEKNLHSLIGTLGTYIILVLFFIISLVIITEKSFISGVKKSSTVVYETAKEETKKIRKTVHEYADERAYQKKDKRMDNRIRGVNLSPIQKNDPDDSDVHEINDEVMHGDVSDSVVYQGHVELEEISYVENNRRTEYESSNEYVMNHNKKYEDKSDEKYENKSEEKYEEDYEAIHTDEDGLYRPKENIEVSEEAKSVMNRRAFSSEVPVKKSSADSTITPKQSSSDSVRTPMKNREYKLPPTTLLNRGANTTGNGNNAKLKEVAVKLQEILQTFGVNATVVDYSRGPSVTRYEIQPETGTRLSKITSLADDIKLNLAATDIRIEPIPGKSTIGIEVPNEGRDSVLIRELIESRELMSNASKIAFAAGKDIAGKVVITDIGKMPHMLVAGTTGSGKSVFTNSIIMSILFRAKPTEVKLIIVDPKVVEFGVYNGIPHLLQPVVTDPKLASNALKWAVAEMSDRYKKFADLNVRDLKGYNEKIDTIGSEMGISKMYQIVIVIDELADLMMVAGKEVEESICRLAQLARAAGIHLIIATQRPSVDVVTGLIKANIPSRCALMVSSAVDSRTILDSAGAEKLLGNGDMLFYPSGYVKPVRLQGAFVSDAEVQKVVDFWKAQAGDVVYDEGITNYVSSQTQAGGTGSSADEKDDYFFEAAKFVIEKEKASTSMLQRMFKIGFNRAARIMDQLCEAGVVGEEEGTKPRKVLMTLEDLEQMMNNQ